MILLRLPGDTIYCTIPPSRSEREFKSLKDMLQYIVDRQNEETPYFQITIDDLYICYYDGGDERDGWHDRFEVALKPYDEISDKKGYLKEFGYLKDADDVAFYGPIYIGFWTTDWDEDKQFFEEDWYEQNKD